jgi:hypothetical protein
MAAERRRSSVYLRPGDKPASHLRWKEIEVFLFLYFDFHSVIIVSFAPLHSKDVPAQFENVDDDDDSADEDSDKEVSGSPKQIIIFSSQKVNTHFFVFLFQGWYTRTQTLSNEAFFSKNEV